MNKERLRKALAEIDQLEFIGFKVIYLRRIFDLNRMLGWNESPDSVFEQYAEEAENILREYVTL